MKMVGANQHLLVEQDPFSPRIDSYPEIYVARCVRMDNLIKQTRIFVVYCNTIWAASSLWGIIYFIGKLCPLLYHEISKILIRGYFENITLGIFKMCLKTHVFFKMIL